MTKKYRPELDGVRCIAVMAVVFYHGDFQLFKGGFVGVDVFFVLSGYLMTSIIITELQNGTFSLLKFYERRARRILPMLYVTLAGTFLPAYAYMLDEDLTLFAKSAFTASLGLSNILFQRCTFGYYDTKTEYVPLVHTWTLGVEEQFYVVIPLLFMALWRLSTNCKHLVVTSLSLLTIGSFLLTIVIGGETDRQISFKFYMLPTRFWELAIGSLLAFVLPREQTKLIQQIMSLCGLCGILVAITCFDKTLPNPSYFTLVPTVSTAFLIAFCDQETAVGKFLAHKVPVTVGLISYSVYLIHQPVFAFIKITSLAPNEEFNSAFLIFLIIGFSYLTWRYIESPFRNAKLVSISQLLGFIATFFIGMSFFQFTLISNTQTPVQVTNMPEPSLFYFMDKTEFRLKCHDFADNQINAYFCPVGTTKNVSSQPTYLLYGDSLALALVSAFDQFNETGVFTSFTHFPNLLPTSDMVARGHVLNNYHGHMILPYEMMQFINKTSSIEKVFLAIDWSLELSNSQFFTDLAYTLQFFNNNNLKVYLFQEPPLQPVNPKQLYKNLVNRNKLSDENLRRYSCSREAYRQHLINSELELKNCFKKISSLSPSLNYNASYIRIEDALCDEKSCPVGTAAWPYFADNVHLTKSGNRLVKPILEKYID
jgi:peptidoglycan/LPS O-acetylase OafA/YrhL